MSNLLVLAVCVIVATGAFAWLMSGIITAANYPVARFGSAVHKALHTLPKNESDAWLFVLLLGISRVLILFVGTVVFGLSLSLVLLPVPEVLHALRDALLNALLLLIAMRLAAIFAGAVIIGGSVRTVLSTLKG